jgi:fructose-bisphosphate aldolase class II
MHSDSPPFGNYRDLGLSNTRKMFSAALRGKFAVPGYNFYNLEQLRAIMAGCAETDSPVILQVLERNLSDASVRSITHMVKGIIVSRNYSVRTVVALHLDHGTSFESCKRCVDVGFSSVMIDGSQLALDENIELTRTVVDYAHKYDVCVEGELGAISGATELATREEMYTRPAQVDSLAISIGTAHGPSKSRLKDAPVQLRLDILDEVRARVGDFPLVLHGASGVPKQYVEILKRYGGQMEGASGVGDDQLRAAVKKGICKANFDTDIKLIFTATEREYLAENPKEFDPRKHLDIAETRVSEYVRNKNRVLGSQDMARYCH